MEVSRGGQTVSVRHGSRGVVEVSVPATITVGGKMVEVTMTARVNGARPNARAEALRQLREQVAVKRQELAQRTAIEAQFAGIAEEVVRDGDD